MRSCSRSRGRSQGRRQNRSRSPLGGGHGGCGGGEVVWMTYLTPQNVPYYVQAESNQTTWERPSGPRDRVVTPPGMTPPPAAGGCPPREVFWVKCFTHDGRPYYFSKELGQSVWEEPRGPNDRIVGDTGPPQPQMPHAGVPHPMMMGHPMMPGMPGYGPGMMMPQGAPAAPMVPPVSPEAVDTFIEKSGLDSSAHKVLQGLAPEVLKEVIDRGAIIEARNPHAVMMGRIREAERGGGRQRENSWVKCFTHDGRPYYFSKELGQSVWEEPRGPNDRIVDAGPPQMPHPGMPHPMMMGHPMMPGMPGMMMPGPAATMVPPVSPEAVESFIDKSGLDSSAHKILQGLAPEVLRKVVERPLRDARNPNAVLRSRIKEAEGELRPRRDRRRSPSNSRSPSRSRRR